MAVGAAGMIQVTEEFLWNFLLSDVSLVECKPTKYRFKRSYSVFIPERSLSLIENSTKIVTLMYDIRMDLYRPQIEIHKAFGRYPIIFHAEIHAIEASALEVARKELIGKKHITMTVRPNFRLVVAILISRN